MNQLVEAIIMLIFGLAIAIINLIDGFNLEIVVLGGLLALAGLIFIIYILVKNYKK